MFGFSCAQTDYFRKSGGHVEVGHPLLDRCSSTPTRTQVSFQPLHLLIVSGRDLSKGLKMLCYGSVLRPIIPRSSFLMPSRIVICG